MQLNPEQTKELIQQYCSQINHNLVWVIAVVALMWLLDPLVKKITSEIKIESLFWNNLLGNGRLHFMYKWIGIGLLALVCILIILVY